ncbi:hypothetical protein CDAR_617951 [Caerostris darwini]|uniref:Uncharacterized protein n=1 Tax=Caerostris darwini TaxID=1538125 RepID=A0AAV4U216_9ARAC|nr:hypothetical protein CDAR_617951 [Caerostris darwini]
MEKKERRKTAKLNKITHNSFNLPTDEAIIQNLVVKTAVTVGYFRSRLPCPKQKPISFFQGNHSISVGPAGGFSLTYILPIVCCILTGSPLFQFLPSYFSAPGENSSAATENKSRLHQRPLTTTVTGLQRRPAQSFQDYRNYRRSFFNPPSSERSVV